MAKKMKKKPAKKSPAKRHATKRPAEPHSEDIALGDLLGTDFAIKEIVHYELYFNKVEKYFYDFMGSDWRVDGVDQYADERAILRLPAGV